MPAARDRTLRQRQNFRLVRLHTTARRQTWGRPVGRALVRVTRDHCTLQALAAFQVTKAPGSRVTTVNAFGLATSTVMPAQSPGFGGASSLAGQEEDFAFTDPQVTSQVPRDIEAGRTTEVVLLGYAFRESPIDNFELVTSDSVEGNGVTLDPFAFLGPVVFVPDPAVEGLSVGPNVTVVKVDVTVDAAHPFWRPFLSPSPPTESLLNYRVTRA